jgi:hypothetical protein
MIKRVYLLESATYFGLTKSSKPGVERTLSDKVNYLEMINSVSHVVELFETHRMVYSKSCFHKTLRELN